MPLISRIGSAASRGFGLFGAIGKVLDPYFKYVTLLLHGDGTNGAQNNTFLDSSTNNFTITRNGNTTQGTFTPYGDNWSNYFDGSGDYLELASNSAFNMNTYCCLEAWVCYTTIGTSTNIVCRDSSYLLAYNFTAIGGTANKFVFTINNGSSWQAVSSTTTPVVGVWYHVVGIKDNTTLRIYINGTQENTATFSGTAVTGSNVMGIGANQNTQNMAGYVSNTRLVLGASSGVLPYTSNFTSPTTPLTAVSGTVLLTCQSNRFIDNSSNNFTITKFGDTSIQRFSPFSPSTAYSTSVIGGSGYFDGSSSLSTSSSNTALPTGTQDFSVELWVYWATQSGSYPQIIANPTTSGFQIYYDVGAGALSVGIFNVANVITYTISQATLNNTWNHIAVTRSGNTFRLFVNGVLRSNGTNVISFAALTTQYVGSDGSRPYTGYITDVRTVLGSIPTAYQTSSTTNGTSVFTPSTTPLSTVSGTALLLNYTNGGIYDNAEMNDLQTVGNAQVSTSVVKFGTGSMYFDGSGDYLTGVPSPVNALGGGNFTVEAWIYLLGYNGGWTIYSQLYSYTSPTAVLFYINGSGSLKLNINGSETDFGSISLNTWHQVALVRNGSTITGYVDGTSGGSTSNSTNFSDQYLVIGRTAFNTASNYAYGYIDDFRITKGYARYTTNYTLPTAAFPNN